MSDSGRYIGQKDDEERPFRDSVRLKLFPHLLDAAKAYQELATCYRLGRQPSDRLHDRLSKANKAVADAEEISS